MREISFGALFALVCLCVFSDTVPAAPAGLLAEWKFDAGRGAVARDTSGHARNATIHGATWVKQADGFAISLDGVDDYVEFIGTPPRDLVGPVTLEAWVKPTRKADGISVLLGCGMSSYLLTLYATDNCYWYIGGPGNSIAMKVKLHNWNHIAATFDGKEMTQWLNGKKASGRESRFERYEASGRFVMGTKGNPNGPRFKGLLDNVRVYDRALSKKELVTHLTEEAAAYGVTITEQMGWTSKGALSAEESTRFFETHPNVIDLEERGDSILFANKQVGLELTRSETGFELTRLYGIAEDQEFLAERGRDLYKIVMTLDPKLVGRDERGTTKPGFQVEPVEIEGEKFQVDPAAAKTISWRRQGTDSESVLHLEWKGIDAQSDKDGAKSDKGVVDVQVTVTLRAGDPLSYWRINVVNRSATYGIARVTFPTLPLAPIGKGEDNILLLPRCRGDLEENPFTKRYTNGNYPSPFNMQFQALYNKQNGKGLFFGTQDSTPCYKEAVFNHTPSEIVWHLDHFPPNVAFAEEDFSLPYDIVAGPFRGDWYDACQKYRAWAIKQTWCQKGPLSKRTDMPKWYKEAPLFLYGLTIDSASGTHSREENLPIIADHFREWLKWAGIRLPMSFDGWGEYDPSLTETNMPFHRRRMITRPGKRWAGLPLLYDVGGNYPKVPAMREFSAVCEDLRKDGGMVVPYIGTYLFDPGPTENSPYAAEARHHAVRGPYGSRRAYPGWVGYMMCGGTKWWRNRLKEQCVLMLEREHVGGFYLDVLGGGAPNCCWMSHGHTAGGGDMKTLAGHGFTKTIYDAVKAKDPDAIITGENPGENMIDVIDGMLSLTLMPDNTAPVFATVYQDYIKRIGLEVSTWDQVDKDMPPVGNDAFFIECASCFVEGMQIGRLRLRPRSGALSFQNPEHKEMFDFLGRIVGYYKQDVTKKFLAYGRLLRPLKFREPSPMPLLSCRTYPAPRAGQFPALMSGVFRTDNGEIGVFVVNASSKDVAFQTELDTARYGMPAGTAVDVDSVAPQGATRNVSRTVKGVVSLKGSLPGHGMTMFRLKPSARP